MILFPIRSIGVPLVSERFAMAFLTTFASSGPYMEIPWLDRDVRVMDHFGVAVGGAKNGKLQPWKKTCLYYV